MHCLANYWYTIIHWPVHLLQERPRMKATKELYTAPLGKKQAMTSPELWPKAQLISAVTAGATLGAGCSWVQLGAAAAGCSFQLRLSWLQHCRYCSIAAGRGGAPTEALWRIPASSDHQTVPCTNSTGHLITLLALGQQRDRRCLAGPSSLASVTVPRVMFVSVALACGFCGALLLSLHQAPFFPDLWP